MPRSTGHAALFFLTLAACAGGRAPETNATADRALRLLAFNDVYRAEGFPLSLIHI